MMCIDDIDINNKPFWRSKKIFGNITWYKIKWLGTYKSTWIDEDSVINDIPDNLQVMGYPAVSLKDFVKHRKK